MLGTGEDLTRRELLRGLGAAAVVVGFDGARRAWVPAGAQAAGRFDAAPDLDGVLLFDARSRKADSRDQGNIFVRTPAAVLRPGSVLDVQKMIAFCSERGIPCAARGSGHTTHGQGLVDNGLIIEMKALNRVHSISTAGAVVDAGATWKQVVDAALAQQLSPPVLVGYLELSVGGTLSVGGVSSAIGGGAQVDNVRELQVVDGTGRLRTCSMTRNRALFEACLGGLGQCGIVVRATLELVPVQPKVRSFKLLYLDNASFFRDFRTLVRRGEADDVYCESFPVATALTRQLTVGVRYGGGTPAPSAAHILRGLSQPALLAQQADQSYRDWVLRTDVLVRALQLLGWDGYVKPWFDVFLPESSVESYVGSIWPQITPLDLGAGLALIFALRRPAVERPFFRIPPPDGHDWYYLFDVLGSSLGPNLDPTFIRRNLARNRRWYDQAVAAGGTRYPIGSLDFDRADWRRHYGDQWDRFRRLKVRHDPAGILTPSAGIFGC